MTHDGELKAMVGTGGAINMGHNVGAPFDGDIPLGGIPKTMSVPEAGRWYFGLSRNGSYAAAARGEIPTLRIGRLLRVPVAACERMLNDTAR